MKKYMFPVILSLCIGSLFAYFLINSYGNIQNISVSKGASEVYYLRYGIYPSKEEMISSMQNFQHYIYNVEDNQYKTYIGNPFTNELINIENDKEMKNWKDESIKVLEGGKEAFEDRRRVYESR